MEFYDKIIVRSSLDSLQLLLLRKQSFKSDNDISSFSNHPTGWRFLFPSGCSTRDLPVCSWNRDFPGTSYPEAPECAFSSLPAFPPSCIRSHSRCPVFNQWLEHPVIWEMFSMTISFGMLRPCSKLEISAWLTTILAANSRWLICFTRRMIRILVAILSCRSFLVVSGFMLLSVSGRFTFCIFLNNSQILPLDYSIFPLFFGVLLFPNHSLSHDDLLRKCFYEQTFHCRKKDIAIAMADHLWSADYERAPHFSKGSMMRPGIAWLGQADTF